ncbi:MAG: hypothetical protein A2168_03205 [Planctomycetes bacterium RBG_13_50_24]|nr:MAG: hypothetical protein A2168_03205 [Planctomycetes bacterium RBG_13_50_24]
MAKSLVVFIILLVTAVFISGCNTVEPKSAEIPEVGSLEAGPDNDESNKIAPVDSEPDKVKTGESVPNVVESAKAEHKGLKPVPAASFHDKCANILKEYVNDKGMVDYQGLRRKRIELRALLREFDNLERREYESWSSEDKIVFWINVYNLQKLSIVTDNYPIKPSSRILTVFYRGTNSIRHIEEKITGHKFLVMDEEFTFGAIEKRFFRGEFDDPRIFFAISSACLSSPPLRNEPYYGSNLSQQLDEQTGRFLSSPLAFGIDREKRKVYLSALFQSSWYGREFVKKFAIDRKFKDQSAETRAVLNFITNYISKKDVTFLETGNYTIKYMTYDWTINDGS